MPSHLINEHSAGDELLLDLGQAFWSWTICSECRNGNNGACARQGCARSRAPQLQRYVHYYKTIVSIYLDTASATNRLIESREDLLAAVAILRANPTATLSQLSQLAFSPSSIGSSTQAQHDAINLVVKILFMVDSSALHYSSDRLERGAFRIAWKSDVALSEYLQDIFPTSNHHILSHANSDEFIEMTEQLKAVNLKKDLGMTISPTSDIQNHLRLDRRNNILEIYHYTAFLKEQLRVTRDERDCSDLASTLKTGSLPRQLVLEVLESLQGILFPIADKKSKQLLQSLVSTCGLDPDILRVEVASVRRVGEENVTYVYLAERLSELYNELQSPRPRGRLEQIIERKSGARYVMMATLIGVVFAVLLGMVALGVSCFQTYIAYQAWKYPVSPPSD